MKIAIEAQRIFRPDKHGMDFVILETIRELQQMDKTNEYYIFVSPGSDRCLKETLNFHIKEVKCPFYPLWEQVALPIAIGKIKPDILHCTSNTAPYFCKVPIVLTLHDIIFLEPKQGKNNSIYQSLGWYYRKWLVPHLVSKCKKIITVSHTEYQNIQNQLHLSNEQLVVIHNGFSAQYKPIDNSYEVTKKYCIDKEYLLFLGNTDPRKNTVRILKAYSLYLKKSKKARPLIITGLDKNIIDKILSESQITEIRDKLICPGYIPGEDLPFLYSGAYVFINASLREGFGIPILESMACGTPVITSNISSMPEVAGEQGILVNPYNENEIADQLILLETNNNLYEQQKQYGLNRAKEFSWRKTAEQVFSIYQFINTQKS